MYRKESPWDVGSCKTGSDWNEVRTRGHEDEVSLNLRLEVKDNNENNNKLIKLECCGIKSRARARLGCD